MDGTGFPGWTLWGMGLSALGALVAIALAYLAQSPRLLTRLSLGSERLDLRAKSFTGYGLALLLLAMGFFMAGVPLGRGGAVNDAAESTLAADDVAGLTEDGDTTDTGDAGEAGSNGPSGQSGAMVGLPTSSSGGSSGAMGSPAATQPAVGAGEVITGTAEIAPPPGTGQAATAVGTPRPTETPTATPTPTPSPTPTATPILVPTARINDSTSTLPVRQLPGGPALVILVRGDTVIPLTGNAFYQGEVWQEIQTVTGIVGWVQDRFLDYDEPIGG